MTIHTSPSPPRHSHTTAYTFASLNCQSLRSHSRLTYLLSFLHQHTIDILCVQETHHREPAPTLPAGYTALFSDGNLYNGRRGVAIIARRDSLRTHRVRLTLHQHIATQNFQLLAAKVGNTMVVSVYVFNDGPDPIPAVYMEITAAVLEIRGPKLAPLVLAGDFNHPRHHPGLHEALAAGPGLIPLFPLGFVTRTSSESALDNIFFTPRLHISPGSTLVAESDHLALVGQAAAILQRHGPPRSTRHQPTKRICWRSLLPPQDRLLKPAHENIISQLTADIQALPSLPDLATYEARLLTLAAAHLGTQTFSPSYLEPWMHFPPVQEAYRNLARARRALHRRRNPRSRRRVNLARRRYAYFRRVAQDRLHISKLQQINKGRVDIMFQATRLLFPKGSPDAPHLDAEATVKFWSATFTRDSDAPGPSICGWTPLAEDMSPLRVVPDEVIEAISSMALKSTGPSHLPVRFLQTFKTVLAPSLAQYFTTCLQKGLPPSLKQGTTTLIAKDSPPSPDPARYRPITVLPAISRLFLKVIDRQLRRLIVSSSTLSLAQAGFVPGRSTIDQAFVLETLRATIRSFRGLLFSAFLDIEKAFDSIPHEDLLLVLRDVINLPPHWVEALRLILMGNTTTILGRRVLITRGCLQGAPLSPLLCILYIDDLCQYLHRHGPIPDYPLSNLAIPASTRSYWLLLSTLLFADDIALISISRTSLDWLLAKTSDWMELRRLKISDKSLMLPLAATPLALTTLPTFSIGGIDLAWAPSFSYLGHLFTAYYSHQPTYYLRKYSPAELGAFHCRLHILRQIFTSASGTTIVSPRVLAIAIKQLIHAKALYASTVVRLDTTTLDTLVFTFVRKILRLPPDTSSAFLWVTLNLWPATLYVDRRILRSALSFHKCWFYVHIVTPILALPDNHPAVRALLNSGPYPRMRQTMNRYQLSVLDMKEDMTFISSAQWYAKVDAAIWHGFRSHFLATITPYPAPYLTHFQQIGYGPEDMESLSYGYPTFLKLGDHFSSIALRYLSYSLRRLDRPRHALDRPDCHWCGLVCGECGIHLIDCPRIPPRFAATRHRTLCTIWYEVYQNRTLSAAELLTTDISIPHRTQAYNLLRRLHWPHMSRPSLIRTLKFVGTLINHYRSDWKPQRNIIREAPNPIWEIFVP